MSKLLVSCGFKRARRWSPKSSLLQLAMDQASAHPEAVDWSNIGNRICSGHTYATLFPINSQNFRNSSAEFRNSYAEFKNSSDHIYVLGTIAGPFWLAAGLPQPRPRNRPETNTFACVGFLSLDRGCELYLPPKFAGWERRPMVFSCKIRCKLHVGPYVPSMKFSRQGPFNDSGKTFYPFTLLALLFSERHWLCSQTIPTIPMFFAYSKVKGICHMGEMVQYLQTMSCKQVQKHRGLCCFPIPTKKTQDQRFEITLMKQIQRFNFWGSGFSNSWSTEEAPPSDYPSSSSWLKLKQRTITGVEINQKENNAKSKGVCRLSSWFNLPVPLTNHVPPQRAKIAMVLQLRAALPPSDVFTVV